MTFIDYYFIIISVFLLFISLSIYTIYFNFFNIFFRNASISFILSCSDSLKCNYIVVLFFACFFISLSPNLSLNLFFLSFGIISNTLIFLASSSFFFKYYSFHIFSFLKIIFFFTLL